MISNMQDVIVIGGGILGSTISRYLSVLGIRTTVIDAGNGNVPGDVKAMTHTGCLFRPNSVSAHFISRGFLMMEELAKTLPFSFHKNGAFIPCFTNNEMIRIREYHQCAKKCSITDLRILWSDVLHQKVTSFSPDFQTALFIPRTAMIDPQEYIYAVREDAANHGCTYLWNHEANQLLDSYDHYEVVSSKGALPCRYLINAAGRSASLFHQQLMQETYTLCPLKRNFYTGHIYGASRPKSTLIPLPSAMSKEITLIPTSRDAYQLSVLEEFPANISLIESRLQSVLPGVHIDSATPSYTHTTYCISEGRNDVIAGKIGRNYYETAGFDTCGITASPAIAQAIAEQIKQEILG